MIKSHKELKQLEVEITDQVVCNMCGKPIKMLYNTMPEDHIHIHKNWNVGSSIHENEQHDFDLCQDCYDKMIKTFKIQPSIYNPRDDFQVWEDSYRKDEEIS